MRPVAACGVLHPPSSKAGSDASRRKNGALRCPGVSPGFESPSRRDISGREARQKERRVNDETQQRVMTALAAGITFALSRLVTQRFIRVPERRGHKGRRPGSGPQGRHHRGFDRAGLGNRAAVASGTPVDSLERRLRKKRAGVPVGPPSRWRTAFAGEGSREDLNQETLTRRRSDADERVGFEYDCPGSQSVSSIKPSSLGSG
jgi:hypothetical protein